MSEYSVEQVDEDTITEFIQHRGCRRTVLAHYLDGDIEGTDCKSTNSVLYNHCLVQA
jgi:hypothetical protein